jgi:catechol 2,3-dioxygenase-like lactoylglutathione lyase family enzyme
MPAPPPADAPPVPPGAVLEAAVYATDLDAAEAFYGGLLGLPRLMRAGERHVFYRVGDTILLIFNPDATERPPDPGTLPVPPHGAHGPGHVCFAMSDAEINAIRARLDRVGVQIDSDFHWPNGARSLYVRDPAGNSVEFAEPKLWAT